MYGLPEFEIEEPQVTYDGDPVMSPQIEEISSRLRENETFDFLGDGRLCDVCAKLDLCWSDFNVNDNNNTMAAISAAADNGTTSMPYNDSHTSNKLLEAQIEEVPAPSLIPPTSDGGGNIRQGVWQKVRSVYKRRIEATKSLFPSKSGGRVTHEQQELPPTAALTPLAIIPATKTHLTSREDNNKSDTSTQLRDNEKEGQIIPLGRVKDVIERQNHCALCRLVIRVIDEERKLENGGVPIDRDGSDDMIEVALVWTRHEDILEVNNKPELYRLRMQLTLLNADGKGNPGVSNTTLKIEPFSTPEQAPKIFAGRVYGEGQIDVGLLKTWVQCCDDWHIGECKTSFRARLAHPAGEFTMYAIDVRGMQLKTLSERDRYCALSYVWGRKPFYRLLAENLCNLLSAPGSINAEIIDQLPQAIVGAIKLTRDLGIPYLWVDSICIPQDDDSYKASAICRMHLVYSKAELTIVAASGPDSFYGLPGYGGVPRDVPQAVQRVKKKDGKDLVLGVRHRYQWSLAMSPHGERGWTYVPCPPYSSHVPI